MPVRRTSACGGGTSVNWTAGHACVCTRKRLQNQPQIVPILRCGTSFLDKAPETVVIHPVTGASVRFFGRTPDGGENRPPDYIPPLGI
jgi:hypothetical protein